MTNLINTISQLSKCYKLGKETTNSTYNYCNFQSSLDELGLNASLTDLLNKMNQLEKNCIQNSKKTNVIQNNGSLLAKLAYTTGLRTDSKKFKYIEMGETYSKQF